MIDDLAVIGNKFVSVGLIVLFPVKPDVPV